MFCDWCKRKSIDRSLFTHVYCLALPCAGQRARDHTSEVMDCVIDQEFHQNEGTISIIAKHDTCDEEDEHEVHDDLICDIPDEDSILLVQFQGSAMATNQNIKMVKSFSLTKVTFSVLK